MHRMAADQLGLVRCGDIIRVIKLWLRETRQESTAYWEKIADNGVELVKAIKTHMSSALLLLQSSARTIQILPAEVRSAAELTGSNAETQDGKPEYIDHEIHYNVKIGIGRTGQQDTEARTSEGNVKFRLGLHPPSEEINSYLASQNRSSDPDATTLVIDFGMQQDISGKSCSHPSVFTVMSRE